MIIFTHAENTPFFALYGRTVLQMLQQYERNTAYDGPDMNVMTEEESESDEETDEETGSV